MKTLITIILSLLITTGTMYGQTSQPPAVPPEETPEVQTRGPINEAFAQPVTIEDNADFTVLKAPPADIYEAPPAERPVGDQFTWIPGYWAWDSDREKHIWVSGCWRAVPPGKYWVPGYWARVQGGYRWVAGFWASAGNREIEYLPPPPAVTYIEPAGADRPDMIWVPACYYWSRGRYTLRSGYWLQARPDWVWVPSHYVWTPRGYVFVNGHWDYPFRGRGVLFAPVYFRGDTYRGHRISYSLSIVVDLGNLNFSLFTRPRYRHYYFGDYYDSFYIGVGIFPWFECVSRRTWYDPIYLHDRWHNKRHRADWRQHERREYEQRRTNKDLRPPRTYHEMERRIKTIPEPKRKSYEIAAPMKRIIETKATPFKYRNERPEERRAILRQTEDIKKNSRETQRPAELARPDVQTNVRSATPRPEVRNTPDQNQLKQKRSQYPRPVQQKETQAPSITPPVRKNVTEDIQPDELHDKPENARRPSSQVDERYRNEFKPKRVLSRQDEKVEVKENKARPGVERIKR